MPRFEDYPFDPELEGRSEELYALEKLRAVRDRGLARTLFDLWEPAQRNAADPNYQRRSDAAARMQELAAKRRTVARALKGEFGRALSESLKRLGFDAQGPEPAIEKALAIVREHRRSAA
jgi:predicted nucleotidyltransferase component of viral defense system